MLSLGAALGSGDILLSGGYKRHVNNGPHILWSGSRTHEGASLLHHGHCTTLEKVKIRFMGVWTLPHEGYLDGLGGSPELINGASNSHITVDKTPPVVRRFNIRPRVSIREPLSCGYAPGAVFKLVHCTRRILLESDEVGYDRNL